MDVVETGAPIEEPSRCIGRRSLVLVDRNRDSRGVPVEVWYPAVDGGEARSVYEVLPGVAFRGVTALDSPSASAGSFPLVLMSHGRTGTRISYSLLCEALAARGAVVVAPDHSGDTLVDWLTGANVDDRTNEVNRVLDAGFVLDTLLSGRADGLDDVADIVDLTKVALMGHSYGAYTAFASTAGSRGVSPRSEVGAVVGLQPYVKSMSETLLGRVTVPSLLLVGERDTVTPAATDADRAWRHVQGRPAWRVDLLGAGHQASSDIALYAELVDQVPNLPDLVRDYLVATAEGTSGPGIRPWRSVLADQVAAVWAFLQVALQIDEAGGEESLDLLVGADGLVVASR